MIVLDVVHSEGQNPKPVGGLLLSTKTGAQGRSELFWFIDLIGVRPTEIFFPAEPQAHIRLTSLAQIVRALEAGATVISRHTLGQVLRSKRAGLEREIFPREIEL